MLSLFIESFLLAQELAANPDIARDYFSLDDYDFDLYTFDLYCEIQPCEGLVNDIIELLENSVVQNRITSTLYCFRIELTLLL